ncbi:pentatricopeptide repeat-containing protein At4g02750-like isoform X2 [Selaginella moellendorffii]|uniref:pentatricopeptide repeat-containing protein At4g02750-like isoform X2 n=1 Tax=Selaginella moellendorffii TaxID=88036 RepID=UPI000D1CC1F0|nr:pentatricopeptide repeat-containing protein At4g02750-like isoform X2 [Selaginella moellendorffii]|eukprot:XP_024532239.1 pentatricopeptide repeat-containing protein At4g02750-like isoform X2 [Selaginella moellendorffii]
MGCCLWLLDRIATRSRPRHRFLPHRDYMNVLINAFVRSGQDDRAGLVFERIQRSKRSLLEHCYPRLCSKGHLEEVKTLSDRMPEEDVVAGNARMGAYAQHGHLGKAIAVFDPMEQCNVITSSSMMVALIHGDEHDRARWFFDSLAEKSVVTWNSMIHADVRAGHMDHASKLFHEMPVLSCNAGYDLSCDAKSALQIFERMPQRGTSSGNAMFRAFAQNGAREIFHSLMRHRDVVSWNIAIASYAQSSDNRPFRQDPVQERCHLERLAKCTDWRRDFHHRSSDGDEASASHSSFWSSHRACSHDCFLHRSWKNLISRRHINSFATVLYTFFGLRLLYIAWKPGYIQAFLFRSRRSRRNWKAARMESQESENFSALQSFWRYTHIQGFILWLIKIKPSPFWRMGDRSQIATIANF